MSDLDLDGPASLTVWQSRPDCLKAVLPVEFATVREALAAAADALTDPEASPWIITAGGLILTPAWLEDYLDDEAAPLPPSTSMSWPS